MFRKAILIIHGYAGGTYDEEYLANFLELNRNFDVFTFTLPGHASKNSKITKEDWIKSVEEHTEMLIKNNYKNIYVIGHSMGGVLATHLATKYKEIKKIVLLAPAFKYLALDENGNFNLIKGIKKSPSLIKNYTKEEVISRVMKVPFKSVNEFVNLVKMFEETPKEIKIPILIIQGLDDDIVPIESSKYVYNLVPHNNKKILFFENTNHDIFKSEKKEEISIIIKDFLKQWPIVTKF